MFDFAWSEIALIGVVALIAIGPKDLPVAIKAVAEMIKKARRMAGEFQTHVDEMVREANLHEVRDQINDIRRMDIKGQILKAVDEDGSLRRTMAERPLDFSPPPPVVPVADSTPPLPEVAVDERAAHDIAPPSEAPAFVPPAFVPPAYAQAAAPEPHPPQPHPPQPPAFVPPASAAAQTLHA
jgi:sec-independent protein translocase protein TatB